jgi:hypothetical protein
MKEEWKDKKVIISMTRIKDIYIYLILALVISIILNFISTPAIYSTSTSTSTSNLTPKAIYIIYNDGINNYAKNENTGNIDYSDTNAALLINNVLGNLTFGRTWQEKVVIKGNFTINNTVQVPSYTFLQVIGKLTLANGANATVIDTNQYAKNVTISDAIIDGNKANQNTPDEIYGIRLWDTSKSTIENVTIFNTKFDGLMVANGLYNRIQNVDVEGSDHNGITFWGETRSIQRGHIGSNLIVKNNTLEGVGLGNISGVKVINIYSFGNSRGVAMDDGSGNVIVNHISSGDEYGAYISSDYVIYSNFHIINSTDRGIYIKSGSVLVKNPDSVNIINGYIGNAGAHGIDIDSAKTVTVNNVTIDKSASTGISIVGKDNFENISILNCIINTNKGSGIRIGYINDIVNTVSIKNCTIKNNDQNVYLGDNITMTLFEMRKDDLINGTSNNYYQQGSITTSIMEYVRLCEK